MPSSLKEFEIHLESEKKEFLRLAKIKISRPKPNNLLFQKDKERGGSAEDHNRKKPNNYCENSNGSSNNTSELAETFEATRNRSPRSKLTSKNQNRTANNNTIACDGSSSVCIGPRELMQCMSLHLREFFNGRNEFKEIFTEFDSLNMCLFETNERIRCYRYELGKVIENVQTKMMELLERTLDATF